jgi:alkanesulfonate monooxygenase SsuD/methylene tetrahydromethanopterin reductase-like flavin-dependent oxidoreductase (luciferase family)
MKPAFAKGAGIAGRDPNALAIAMKPLVATAPDEDSLQARIREVRARVSFYASTPAYRKAFEIYDLGDLAEKLSHLSRAQKWDEMPDHIDDDVLNKYAVVGTYEEIGQKMVERFDGVLTDVGFSIPVNSDRDRDVLAEMLNDIQAGNRAA